MSQAAPSARSNTAALKEMRVLVIDDDPVYRETARMFLMMFGRKVTVAENGSAGLNQLQHGDFDIIIVDMEMPDMTGLEVIGRLRLMERHAQVPVIMVTSRDDAMAIDRAYELGASSFVVKPVNWTLLDHYLRFVRRASDNEQAARRAQAEAEALARTKDNLLSVLRHEMKTPLNAITGFTRLAAEARANGDVEAMRDHLAEVSASGARLLASFTDMVAYSDLISHRLKPKLELISPEWVFDDASEARASEIAGRGLRLVRDAQGGDARIEADAALLADAVRRLIDNVITHADGAKSLVLRSEVTPDGVLLSVTDDGEGMASEAIPACLAPFEQADMSLSRPNQGLGLGLPIAREIAQLHGGSLIAASAPGRGMRVDIRLPKN
jgi:two-component system, sensor histidine kinase and response regulator